MEKLTGYPNCFPSIIADKVCGLAIVISTLAALYHQQKTGKGQFVNIPMADTLFAFNLAEHLGEATFSQPDEPRTAENKFGYPVAFVKYHGDSPAKDGYISIHPYSMQNIKDMLTAAGREDILESDPYFSTWENSGKDAREHLYEVVHEITPNLTVVEWMEVASKCGIPAAVPTSLDNVWANSYLRAGKALQSVEHPTEGQILTPGYPVMFSETPVENYGFTPRLNSDKDLILDTLKNTHATAQKEK